MNSVNLYGRLVRPAVVTKGKSGTPIFNNAIAVDEYDKSAPNGRSVSFFNFTVFGNFAEVLASKLDKGDNIAIQGRLRQRSYETPEGEKRNVVEIVANEVNGESLFKPKANDNNKDEEQTALATA